MFQSINHRRKERRLLHRKLIRLVRRSVLGWLRLPLNLSHDLVGRGNGLFLLLLNFSIALVGRSLLCRLPFLRHFNWLSASTCSTCELLGLRHYGTRRHSVGFLYRDSSVRTDYERDKKLVGFDSYSHLMFRTL